MFKFLNSKKGFSLTELMIVVVVLGVLAAIGVPTYSAVMKSSHKKLCANQMLTLKKEAENYCIRFNYNENFSYAIKADEDGNRIFVTYTTSIYNGGISQPHVDNFEQNVHPNVQPCPAGGTYYVKVIAGQSGVPEIEAFCDCEDHNPDGMVPETTKSPFGVAFALK